MKLYPHNRDAFQTLTVAPLPQKSTSLIETCVSRDSNHQKISYSRAVEFTPAHNIRLTTTLISFSHRNISLRSKLFLSSSRIKPVHVFNNPSVCFKSLDHLIHTEDSTLVPDACYTGKLSIGVNETS